MPDTTRRVNHAESFCLMTYRASDGEEEIIWNGRDGAAPMWIVLRSGKEAQHTRWQQDVRVFDYQPPPGTRMFVDLDLTTARRIATEKADRFPDICPASGPKREAFIEQLAQSFVGDGHQPHLVEVDQ